MKMVLYPHVICGVIALFIFIIPLITKKGGRAHVLWGRSYTLCMTVVILGAFIITPWRFFIDEQRSPKSQEFAVFLLFVAILSASTLHFGLRALRHKNRTFKTTKCIDVAPSSLLIATSLLTGLYGILNGSTLLTWIPIAGLLSGVQSLKYWLTAPTEKMHWWYAHIQGMFGACIATVTAFFVTALPNLMGQEFQASLLLWLLPSVIMVPIEYFILKNYRVKFGDA
ncbi:MAG: DUF2306 domain-containing protein [Oligoflexia bacterium]|nr:DUF2306 domain-containing protein [Oligoflexia bacterium]